MPEPKLHSSTKISILFGKVTQIIGMNGYNCLWRIHCSNQRSHAILRTPIRNSCAIQQYQTNASKFRRIVYTATISAVEILQWSVQYCYNMILLPINCYNRILLPTIFNVVGFLVETFGCGSRFLCKQEQNSCEMTGMLSRYRYVLAKVYR